MAIPLDPGLRGSLNMINPTKLLRSAVLALALVFVAPLAGLGVGVLTVEAAQAGLGVGAHFSLLGAMLLVALFLAPLAAAAALRIALE